MRKAARGLGGKTEGEQRKFAKTTGTGGLSDESWTRGPFAVLRKALSDENKKSNGANPCQRRRMKGLWGMESSLVAVNRFFFGGA